MVEDPAPRNDRRAAVLEAALATFAHRGYRRTSMDDVARDARISRPGLYLHFASKQALLRAAVDHALARDVAEAESLLAAPGEPLRSRLLEALDRWAGQYTGPLSTDLEGLLEQDASLLGDVPATHRERFTRALEGALGETASTVGLSAREAAQVVLALSVGTKHQAADRADFRERMRRGLQLLVR